MLNKIVIVIAIIVLVIGGFFGYLYITQKDSGAGVSGVVSTVRNFFPFGNEADVATTNPQNTNEPSATVPNVPTVPQDLRQIYSFPVAGAEAFIISSSTVVRFLEKSTGNMFEAQTALDTVDRISNTTIPKIAEAIFIQKNSVLFRYLKDDSDLIETVFGTLSTTTNATSTTTTLGEIQSTYLTPNIKEIAMSPKKDQIFYTVQSGSGSIGTISNPDGTKKVQLFDSPIREWNISWPKTNTVTITTKASASVPGYLYFVNTTTGKMERILGNVLGLTTLTNSTASSTIYNQNDSVGNTHLSLFDIKTKTSTKLNTITFTEKCVWSKKNVGLLYCAVPENIPGGSYPDAWYKGLTSFSDSLWKIDTATGQTDLLVNIKEVSGKDLDIINMSLSEKEDFLVFSNKTDLSLWGFKIPM